jgi:SAM-dependent methyltransferase
MEEWQRLEFEYARRLRESMREERRTLYSEAYEAVTAAIPPEFWGVGAEQRAAGTTSSTVIILRARCQPQERVLEIGCGRGYLASNLAPHVAELVGVDVSSPALEEAAALLRENGQKNARFVKTSGDDLRSSLPEASFDRVISVEMYEHLHPDDARRHLEEVAAVLRPGGEAVFVTPSRVTGPHDITAKIYPEEREPLGFHLNETTHRELLGQLRELGFTRFRSCLPLRARLSFLPDVWYPAVWTDWFERLYLAIGRPRALGAVARFIIGLRLAARSRASG